MWVGSRVLLGPGRQEPTHREPVELPVGRLGGEGAEMGSTDGGRGRRGTLVEERELTDDHDPLTVVESESRWLTDPVCQRRVGLQPCGAFCPQGPSCDSPSHHP